MYIEKKRSLGSNLCKIMLFLEIRQSLNRVINLALQSTQQFKYSLHYWKSSKYGWALQTKSRNIESQKNFRNVLNLNLVFFSVYFWNPNNTDSLIHSQGLRSLKKATSVHNKRQLSHCEPLKNGLRYMDLCLVFS